MNTDSNILQLNNDIVNSDSIQTNNNAIIAKHIADIFNINVIFFIIF